MGWVAPATVSAKIIIQVLWMHRVGWDDPLSEDLHLRCLEYQSQLSDLNQIVIPRWTGQSSESSSIEIHGFSDASNVAYAAVVYLRVESLQHSTQISLLYAKTRVAPLKVQSIPRLELCAALLLAKAIEFVQGSMRLSHVPVYCWSDSSVVLSWLRSIPSRWTTFVANRVSSIITTLPNAVWRHIPSADNPADCASRGISVPELVSHPLWWSGPPWLGYQETEWPKSSTNSGTDLEKRRDAHAHVTHMVLEWNLPDEVSSWTRMLRITAYVRRFVFNARNPRARVAHRYLTASEIKQAKVYWIKIVQAFYFRKELREILDNGMLKKNVALSSLNPYLDNDGVLRVGGRLRRAELSEAEKFPIILPKSRVSELIVRHMHTRSLHGGLQTTLRMLRQMYWILGARNLVKYHIRNCVKCVRQRAVTSCQRMGDLPEDRVKSARPFANTGVDYAGPFLMRTSKGRGHKSYKAYIALFVCMATRAIHLEVVSDYSTDGFLAAFDRFSARRGLPAVVYSDNGTTFNGADRELSRRICEILQDTELRNHFSNDEVEWRFIPPAAPHFGGLWEAGVKSVKAHLRRIMGDFLPTFEEFATLLCNIECILNSRPISPLFDDHENFDALTPGHFLVGSYLKSVPNSNFCDLAANRLSRWQAIQQIHQRFWKVWSADYLDSLQQRSKWRTTQNNIIVEDLVLLRSPNLPPTKWELGRIVQCHPGDDNLVRVVSVKTARSVLKRPITQLCKLPDSITNSVSGSQTGNIN